MIKRATWNDVARFFGACGPTKSESPSATRFFVILFTVLLFEGAMHLVRLKPS